jgi:hypothetical protein
MTRPSGVTEARSELRAAMEYGQLGAVAGLAQRRLRRHAEQYGDLFGSTDFDDTFFSSLAMVGTYCAPDVPAEQAALAHRAGLWIFGLDRLIDSVSGTRAQVDGVVAACLAAARGEPGATEVSRFLADLRGDLAGAPSFGVLGPVWEDQVARTLRAMAREWDWRGQGTPVVTLDEYLDNVDSVGFGVVYLAHWIATERRRRPTDVAALVVAGRRVTELLRLVNDLGTHRREQGLGDVNALSLGFSVPALTDRIELLVEQCQQAMAPLRRRHPGLTRYLDRHVGFNLGFYRSTDYWSQG